LFCPKCGKELPADSQFCLSCGDALFTRPKRKTQWLLWVVLLVILIGFVWWASSNPAALSGPLLHRQYTQVAQQAATVPAISYRSYKFSVPTDATNVFMDGHFSATGGAGNDIEVFVLDEDAFVNFQNRHPSNAYYSSGKVTQDAIRATLPGGGTYYLVFSNRFSLISPKAIQVDATLHYTE
jgi:predicted nucleic acid-binding Zn ribbon protein